MHGSLNWVRSSDSEIRFSPEVTLSGHVQVNNPTAVSAALAIRALILPNLRKFESTLLERIYFDLLRLLANCLERDNSLLIAFGFSFADEHILDITRRALRNPTSQLIIFGYSNDDANAFEVKFAQHRNVLVVGPGEGQPIDFTAFNSILQEIVPVAG